MKTAIIIEGSVLIKDGISKADMDMLCMEIADAVHRVVAVSNIASSVQVDTVITKV